MRNISRFLVGAFLLALAVGPAFGAFTTYSNMPGSLVDNAGGRSLWEGAITDQHTVTFDTAPYGTVSQSLTYDWLSGTYSQVSGAPTLSATQMNFCRFLSANCGTNIDSGTVPGGGANRYVRGVSGTSNPIRILLPENTTALAMDLWTMSAGLNLQINIFSDAAGTQQVGSTYTLTTPNYSGGPGFFGLTGDQAIAFIQVASASGEPILDRFDVGSAAAALVETPEVPTLGYVGIGFMALLVGRRKGFVR
jgi:hypothetical protein